MSSLPILLALAEEAFAGIWRARRMTSVSTLQAAVSIFLVGVFLLAAENLHGLVDALRNESAITVFLRSGVTTTERETIERVARASGLVAGIRRISPEEAQRRFVASWRSLETAARSLSSNPFPESLELDLHPGSATSTSIPAFLQSLATQPGAEDVQFDVEWVRRLRSTVNIIRSAGLLMGLCLAFGAAFTIGNVVRLTILLHRDEIEILRLVGAPEVLIRGPFLVGGVLQGLFGGLLALGALAGGMRLILGSVNEAQSAILGMLGLRFLSPSASALLVAGGALAGLLGGLVAVQRRNM